MRLGDRGVMPAARTEFALLRPLGPKQAPVARPSPCQRPSTGRGAASEAFSMTTATWNPERVALLRNFVGAGLTCSQIAAEIGVTRNAVIGKIHRLGLGPGRPAAAPGRACPPRTRRPRLSSQRQLLRLIAADATHATGGAAREAEPVDSAQRCSLLELAQGKCRWPVGHGSGAADFVFCGNEAVEGFSYCAGHARLAYRTPERRRA
jgi:GcrA cell cycle regulator